MKIALEPFSVPPGVSPKLTPLPPGISALREVIVDDNELIEV